MSLALPRPRAWPGRSATRRARSSATWVRVRVRIRVRARVRVSVRVRVRVSVSTLPWKQLDIVAGEHGHDHHEEGHGRHEAAVSPEKQPKKQRVEPSKYRKHACAGPRAKQVDSPYTVTAAVTAAVTFVVCGGEKVKAACWSVRDRY